MRRRWLLSLGVTLVVAGFASAQNQPNRTPAAGAPRASVPADLAAAPNKLGRQDMSRALIEQTQTRYGRDADNVKPGEAGASRDPRAYSSPDLITRDQARWLSTPAAGPRDLSLTQPQPGDKKNKLPETALSRHLVVEEDGRLVTPGPLNVPADRKPSLRDR